MSRKEFGFRGEDKKKKSRLDIRPALLTFLELFG